MEKYPDQQLNTAFQAYMKNPNAANQVVQATAKGAPTGLQGLAAAAAAHQFQTDQQAQQQQQMMQQQAQGQPPSIVQQLAMQTSQMPGIMGQLGPSMDLAGAPSSPAPQMQQMAGGGLVAFADGGMVLPPDVLEAIQSHFAQGGEVRGFAEGEGVWEQIKNLYKSNPFDAPSFYEPEPMTGTQMTPEKAETLRNLMQTKTAHSGTSFEDLVNKARIEEYKNKLLSEYSAVKPSSDIEKLSAAARKFNPEVVAEESPWLKGASEEAFSFGKLGRLAGKLPEGVKATGGVLGKLAPYSAALDPRIMALVKTGVGGAEMIGEHAGESETAQKLKDFMINHGAPDLTDFTVADKLRALGLTDSGAGDVLGGLASLKENYASGGDVRGFADGALIKSLTGQSESPGMRLLNRFADMFAPEVNPAISREEFEAARTANAQKERDTATPAPTPRTSTPEQDQADLSRMLGERPRSGMSRNNSDFPEPKTYNAATPPGSPPATPKQEVHEEAQKTDPAFDQAKHDMPTTSTAPTNSGLGGLFGDNMDLGQVRDMISELRGHQTMDPEIAQQLADLKGDAQTNTIVQSLLGGLGAGLSSPYGGRFALGKAALGALSGFEQGSKGE